MAHAVCKEKGRQILSLCAALILFLFSAVAAVASDFFPAVPGDFAAEFYKVERKGDENFPDLSLRDLSGRAVEFSSVAAGRYALVNFWATWCAPCIREIPSLMELKDYLAARKDANLSVILISMDFPRDNKTLPSLMKRVGLSGVDTLYMSETDDWGPFASEGLPVTMLVDPKGRILYRFLGDADWSSPAAMDFVRAITGS